MDDKISKLKTREEQERQRKQLERRGGGGPSTPRARPYGVTPPAGSAWRWLRVQGLLHLRLVLSAVGVVMEGG